MTKNELLTLAARQRNLPRAALKFAKQTLSDSDIEKRRTPAVTAEKWFDAGCLVGGWSLFGIGTIVAARMLYPTIESGRVFVDWLISTVYGGVGAATIAVVCLLLACLMRQAAGWEKPMNLLAPVAGTDYCEVGLKLLKQGGPLTAAWRDIALQERGQLYVFDLEIMGALGRINQVRAEKTERQAKLDEACRELHGVAGQA